MATAILTIVLKMGLLTCSALANEEKALPEGASVPAFTGLDDRGQAWRSSDHVGKKIVVMYFYLGDFTGGCTRQAQKYRASLAKLEELGVEIVGVSGDEVATHQLFKETYGLKHTLLADPKAELAKLLGLPVKAGGNVRATGPEGRPLFDANGQRINVERGVTLARWTLVIGRNGKIASLRNEVSPATDAEEVVKIVQEMMP